MHIWGFENKSNSFQNQNCICAVYSRKKAHFVCNNIMDFGDTQTRRMMTDKKNETFTAQLSFYTKFKTVQVCLFS